MSITLTTSTNVTITGSQTISEIDNTGVVVSMHVDYKAKNVTFQFQTGAEVSGNFVQGVYGPSVTMNINLVTGVWASFDSRGGLFNQAGTIPPANLTTFINQVISDAGLIEQFAAANFLPGTFVPFTVGGL
jgi:hypothetical protein